MVIALRIGLLIVVIILCGLICISWLMKWLPEPPNKEVTKYLEQTLPIVVKNWNPDDMRKYSGSYLLKHLDGDYKEAYKSLFKRCASNLGSLNVLEKSRTHFTGKLCTAGGCTSMYECSTPAIFEKGKALIATTVYLYHGSSEIESFDVLPMKP